MQPTSTTSTRRVTEEELAHAERLLDEASRAREDLRTAFEAERRRFDRARLERDDLNGRILSYRNMAPVRDFFERTMTRTGGAIVCVITSVGCCILALGLLGAPAWLQYIVTPIVFLVSFAFGRSLLISEDDVRAWKARLMAITPKYNEARERFERAQSAFEVADRHHRRTADEAATLRDLYNRFHGARVRALRASGWEQMRGVPFENFLAAVFEHLGYTVQTTRATGDHGVDLIVSKGPRVIAVQIKGYKNSVGNDAVQQAHSGKDFYQRRFGCNLAAVVTNSTFTKAAYEAAAELGCVLIDGAAIPALIRGETTL